MAKSRGAHRGHDDHEEHEEHVNHEAWVIPYADMLTLLMCLFLVLFAIGRTDAEKAEKAAASFREAVGNPDQIVDLGGTGGTPIEGGDGVLDGAGGSAPVSAPVAAATDSSDPNAPSGQTGSTVAPAVDAAGEIVPVIDPNLAPDITPEQLAQAVQQQALAVATTEASSLAEVQQILEAAAAEIGLSDRLQFRLESRGLIVSIITDEVLFDEGRADLQADGLELLDRVALALTAVPNKISVEGHTDSRPISTTRYPSNWELSTARATSVLRFLIGRHGLEGSRLSAAGYADTIPIADNATVEGAARNRRVEIVVISDVPLDALIDTESGAGDAGETGSSILTVEPDVIPQPAGAATAGAGQ